ncbi:MAG: hypothetical protein ACXWXX_01365, partial [Candidatus Binatia bacterium]
IISLVDVALREVENRSNSLLLLCSEGSRRAQLFESHQLWPAVRHKVTLPTPRHQRRVDEMIVSIKSRGIFAREVSQCRRLLNDYGVDGFYFGMHGVSLAKHKICWASSLVKRNGCRSPRNLGRYYGKQPRSWATPARSIDPAQIGAKEIKRYCLGKEDVDKFLTIAIDKQGFSAWLYNRILNFGRTSAHLTDSKNIKCPAQRRSASVPEFASDNLVRCHRRPLRLHCLHCTPLHTTV